MWIIIANYSRQIYHHGSAHDRLGEAVRFLILTAQHTLDRHNPNMHTAKDCPFLIPHKKTLHLNMPLKNTFFLERPKNKFISLFSREKIPKTEETAPREVMVQEQRPDYHLMLIPTSAIT